MTGLQRPPSRASTALFDVTCDRPWLVARFAAPQRVLSWALARPGFQIAERVAWLEVEDADLPVGMDPAALLSRRLAGADLSDAVAMMTSRDVRSWRLAAATRGEASAASLATVGLGNAARVGGAPPASADGWGTVNLLAASALPLTDAALVEALSIAVEARTAAIMASGWTVDGAPATGTGTDCVAVACPADGDGQAYAGLHTDVGRAIGAAVYEAVIAGARDWMTRTMSPHR